MDDQPADGSSGSAAVEDSGLFEQQDVPEEQDVALWAAQAGAALLRAAQQAPANGQVHSDETSAAAPPLMEADARRDPTDLAAALVVAVPSAEAQPPCAPHAWGLSTAASPAAAMPSTAAALHEEPAMHTISPPTLRVAAASENTDLAALFGRWRMRGAGTRAPAVEEEEGTSIRAEADIVAPVHRGNAGPRYPVPLPACAVPARGRSSRSGGEDSEQRMLSCSTLLAAAAAYEVMDGHRARARGTLASQRAALHQRPTNEEREGGRAATRGRNPFWHVE